MPDINIILQPILIDGEFEKKENRIEFVEAYNNFIKLEDEIIKLDHGISTSGDYGKRYAQVQQEMTSPPIKRRKTQIILDEAQEDAGRILEHARTASQSMVNLLNGFRGRDPRGIYGVLTNLSSITGKGSQFIVALDETIQQFQKVLKILDDIEAMEEGR